VLLSSAFVHHIAAGDPLLCILQHFDVVFAALRSIGYPALCQLQAPTALQLKSTVHLALLSSSPPIVVTGHSVCPARL
jgi:hypothetical protein